MSRTNCFLNKQEDINWLFETHLKNDEDIGWLKTNIKSFILIGNEDCPISIKCYSKRDPKFGDKPFLVAKVTPEREGDEKIDKSIL